MKLIDRRDDSVATEHISCLQSKQTRKGETPFQIIWVPKHPCPPNQVVRRVGGMSPNPNKFSSKLTSIKAKSL